MKKILISAIISLAVGGGGLACTDYNSPTTSRTVYVTSSGGCYHYSYKCAGKKSYSMTLDEAQQNGYRACKNV